MQVFTSVIVLGLCFAAFVISHIKDYKERKAASMIGLHDTKVRAAVQKFRQRQTAKVLAQKLP